MTDVFCLSRPVINPPLDVTWRLPELSASGAEPTSVSAHDVSSVPALARPAPPHPAPRFVTPCQPITRASPPRTSVTQRPSGEPGERVHAVA